MEIKDVFKKIPVSINCAFGDATTDAQIKDTCYKLSKLQYHDAPYGFSTKNCPSDYALDMLKDAPKSKNISIRYSLTGLDEGGYSFNDRIKAIESLKKIFGRVLIVSRPLISGRNVSSDNLERIVKVAANTSGILIGGAVHDDYKRKFVADEVKNELLELCDKYKVKYFNKSSCASAYITEHDCWVHDIGEPQNLEAVDFLGYNYSIIDNKIVLDTATVGDLNFLRMITKSNVFTKVLLNNYNLLSFSNSENLFETTSSWFSWSRNIQCKINCDYCIIHKIEYLDTKRIIGVWPEDLYDFIKESNKKTKQSIGEFKKGSYVKKGNNELVDYNSVRTVQKCYRHAYGN